MALMFVHMFSRRIGYCIYNNIKCHGNLFLGYCSAVPHCRQYCLLHYSDWVSLSQLLKLCINREDHS